MAYSAKTWRNTSNFIKYIKINKLIDVLYLNIIRNYKLKYNTCLSPEAIV